MPVFKIYNVVMDGERPELPPWCPAEYAILVERCWAPQQEHRPFFPEVLELLASCEDVGRDLVLPLPPPEDSFAEFTREDRGYPTTSRERSFKEHGTPVSTPVWQRKDQSKEKEDGNT